MWSSWVSRGPLAGCQAGGYCTGWAVVGLAICSRVGRLVDLWALSGGGVEWVRSRSCLVTLVSPRGWSWVLCLIFIGDLPEGVGSSLRLFADDCVLCGSVGSPGIARSSRVALCSGRPIGDRGLALPGVV